ncbi:hypothetical protein B484DRAFT_407732 [Ochromonadaceae sp. CCMP2298]|nr:hypothetical protein B484DRAFT_407732 [Ochromonadaceae sp. CCMP2298]
MRLKKLTEQEKGEQFRKFVKRFNKHKLPDSYYLPGAEEAEDGDAGDTKDARLLEAVENFGRNWVRVAAHMDGGVNRHQCSKRYTTNADPALQELNNGPWTDKEFELLKSLVEKHSTGRGGRIDWKGHFSPEEDATILAGVAAWDTNETGLWTGLERELGRGSTNIQYRWNTISSQRLHSIGEGESGSKERRGRKSKAREEEEETVKEGSKGKKQKVEASSSSSSSRSADAGAEAGKTVEKVKGEKGEVEVKGEIEEGEEGGGCGEGDAEPSRARARGCSGQVKACSSTAEGPLKKGSFSPKEDAIILARVAAWDMNEQGLWIVLGRELGRAASNILAQWTQIISMIRESAIEKIGSKEERRRLDWERKTAKATKAREEEGQGQRWGQGQELAQMQEQQ